MMHGELRTSAPIKWDQVTVNWWKLGFIGGVFIVSFTVWFIAKYGWLIDFILRRRRKK